jgi:predicted transposase YbfD/YdcC
MILCQIRTATKSNEIQAVKELLDLIDIEGSIVTLDAMGCQREIAAKIIDKKADYILAVKQNHGMLYGEVSSLFSHQKVIHHNMTIEGDHGRIEQRSCSVIQQLRMIGEKEK